MKSAAKKASITLPADIERGLKQLAKLEHRTLSGVIQEASRYYLNVKKYDELQRELARKAIQLGIDTEDEVNKVVHQSRRRK